MRVFLKVLVLSFLFSLGMLAGPSLPALFTYKISYLFSIVVIGVTFATVYSLIIFALDALPTRGSRWFILLSLLMGYPLAVAVGELFASVSNNFFDTLSCRGSSCVTLALSVFGYGFFILIPVYLLILHAIAWQHLSRRRVDAAGNPLPPQHDPTPIVLIAIATVSISFALQRSFLDESTFSDNNVPIVIIMSMIIVGIALFPLMRRGMPPGAFALDLPHLLRIGVAGLVVLHLILLLFIPQQREERNYQSCMVPGAPSYSSDMTLYVVLNPWRIRDVRGLTRYSHYDGFLHGGSQGMIGTPFQAWCDSSPDVAALASCLTACGPEPQQVDNAKLNAAPLAEQERVYASRRAFSACTSSCSSAFQTATY